MSFSLVSSVEKDDADHTHMPRPFAGAALRDMGIASARASRHIIDMRTYLPKVRVKVALFSCQNNRSFT